MNLKEHLRRLLFNDCMITHWMGTNHNAMDRSCVYDRFLIEISEPAFEVTYKQTLDKYEKNRRGFEPAPMRWEDITDHFKPEGIPLLKERIEQGRLPGWRVIGNTVEKQIAMGYWNSIQSADAYVEEVLEKAYPFLMNQYENKISMRKKREDTHPC